ncbi:MAG: glycosyltransferase 87 family protein [Intrasporangium sp.]|uniref:glycosyltransferase 87 family protein n=1 Tax=Intrasporangium sp. TaxID=1925024 RepID=UPI0026476B38|nr:glycosyltransferase 87 family protein [Intrasporangium sp.]MDN5795826.1 glycosyltransferase 87 family protein [Intrasporangium sp.]
MASDPVVRAASEVIGGPPGRYAAHRGQRWQVTAAILSALAAVPLGFGILFRVPCLRTHWTGTEQFWTACYADLPNAFRDAGLGRGLAAYLQGGPDAPTTGQPPLTGFLLMLVGSLVPDGREGTRIAWYFALWAVITTVLVLAMIWMVSGSLRRPWLAAHIALSPVVALVAFISADAVGVALATAGMWAWGRRRTTAAGVLLGLAMAARSYPVLVLLAIGLLALRAGRLREYRWTAGYALLVFLAVVAVTWLLNPEAATSAYTDWATAGPGYGSPWLLPQLAGYPLPTGTVTVLSVSGWVLALLLGAVLALSAPRRPTIGEISLVMVGIVLVTCKSFTVQSSLWLVPLVALAAVPWRDHLIWATGEAVNFLAVWLVIAATTVPDRGLPGPWYAAISMLRVLAVLWLVVSVWLQAHDRPARVAEPDAEPGEERVAEPGEELGEERVAEPSAEPGEEEEAVEVDDLAGPMHGARDAVLVRFS